MVRLSRGIIKILRKNGGDVDEYRYYVVARLHFARRSGIFSTDELCDLLHVEFGYASLHRDPGNDRRRFKARLSRLLDGSILFTAMDDGRYKINAERRILSRYNGGSRTGWYALDDPSVLGSRGRFFDFCVGALLAGNKFRANKNIARYCGCTVRRIQYATSRNHKEGLFHKRFNFIEDFSGTWEEVQKFRAVLLNVHGITSPLPVKVKKGLWALRLNAPNTYSAFVLSGVKGDRAQPTICPVRREQCWFVPVPERNKQLKLFEESQKRWYFNDRIYDADRYVQDHSRYLSA